MAQKYYKSYRSNKYQIERQIEFYYSKCFHKLDHEDEESAHNVQYRSQQSSDDLSNKETEIIDMIKKLSDSRDFDEDTLKQTKLMKNFRCTSLVQSYNVFDNP